MKFIKEAGHMPTTDFLTVYPYGYKCLKCGIVFNRLSKSVLDPDGPVVLCKQ